MKTLSLIVLAATVVFSCHSARADGTASSAFAKIYFALAGQPVQHRNADGIWVERKGIPGFYIDETPRVGGTPTYILSMDPVRYNAKKLFAVLNVTEDTSGGSLVHSKPKKAVGNLECIDDGMLPEESSSVRCKLDLNPEN